VGGRFLARAEVFRAPIVGRGLSGWTEYQQRLRRWKIGWCYPPAIIEHVGTDTHPRAIHDAEHLRYYEALGRSSSRVRRVARGVAKRVAPQPQPLASPAAHAPRSPRVPRFSVVTCLWRRPEISKIMLRRCAALRQELADRLELDVVVVGSEGQNSERLASEHGFVYVERRNRPLGAKWNAGLSTARALDCDGVVILGSDDLVNATLLERYLEHHERGAKFMGLADVYFLRVADAQLLHWRGYKQPGRRRETIGLGRFVDAALLDKCGWRLWAPRIDRGLDASMTQRLAPYLRRAGAEAIRAFRCEQEGIAAIDLKSDVNIWSFDAYRSASAPPADGVPFLAQAFPRAEVQQILALRSSSAATASGQDDRPVAGRPGRVAADG
jgi:hypothetical protein